MTTGTSSWRRVRGGALLIAVAAAVVPAQSAPAATPPPGPCALGDELYAASLFKQAALEYHAIARAARAHRTALTARALTCAHKGLGRVETVRHVRARVISVQIDKQDKAARPPRGGPRTIDQVFIPRVIGDRLVKAASAGREDLIPHVVAREIARDDGLYGIAIARALDRAHYPLAAAAVVAATVDAHPPVSASVPANLLALVDQRRAIDAKREIDAAQAYANAGFDEEAHAAVKRAIALDPDVNVPPEVREPNHNVTWWDRVRGEWGPRLRTAVEIVVAIAAVLLLIAVAARALIRLPGRFRVRPAIEQFTGTPDAVAAGTTAAVMENCAKLRGDGGFRLKTVASSGQSFDAIPRALGEAYAPAGAAIDLLNALARVVPSRSRRITGQVRPYDRNRGVGLTVTFGRHGRVFEEQTVWEHDFGAPLALSGKDPGQASYDRVAPPAAVWLTFIVANRTIWRWLWATIGRERPFTAVGTESWRSYAHFAVGAEQQANGRGGDAVRAYYRALGIDPRNRGAALNLGTLELQQPAIEVRRRGLDRLEELRAVIGNDKTDEQWFRVRYCETVARLDPDLGSYTPRAEAPMTAVKSAVALCAETMGQRPLRRWRLPRPLAWLIGWWPRRWKRKANHEFLRTVLPAALLTLASALQREGRSAAEVPLDAAGLRRQLQIYSRDWNAATFDAAVTHPSLVRFVVETLPNMGLPLNADALYNHACYEARVAGAAPATFAGWEQVEDDLFEAIRRSGPATARWATADPALEAFRADKERRDRLKRVVNQVVA